MNYFSNIALKVAFSVCFNITLICYPQNISINTILGPNLSGDSSIYDIIKINDDKYLVAGKQGYIQYIDSNNILHSFCHPAINSTLLKAEYLGNNKIAVGGTGGTLLFIDEPSTIYTIKQIPHFSYACFYDILQLNDSSLLLAGGHRKIAEAKKRLPRGFIIETNDYGETWTYRYRNPFRMVWDIEKDSKDNIIASTYSPFNTKILELTKKEKNLLIKCKILIHAMDVNPADTSIFVVGSQNHKYRNTASLMRINNKKVTLFERLANAGIFWDIKRIGNYYFASGCKGMLYSIDDNGTVTPYDTNIDENIYCLIEIDNNSFYAVGSNQTILKVDIGN